MHYNWQHPDWPNFHYNIHDLQTLLYQYGQESNLLVGNLNQLSSDLQNDTMIDVMLSEALKTSEIEGEKFASEDVRSSLRNQLGLSQDYVKDPRAKGIAHLMTNIRQTFAQPLTQENLFSWHSMILSGSQDNNRLEIGRWRSHQDPMQIVSGPYGREQIHFEAPPSHQVAQEMTRFIAWFNKTNPAVSEPFIPGPVRAAIAHLYFESIHPFVDGNGRVGRAICEKALSQDLKAPILLSLSTTLQKNKKAYYQELAFGSRFEMDITAWVTFFCKMVFASQQDASLQISFVIQKAKFWRQHESYLNERQQKVLRRMFQEGPSDFTGGISAQKYIKIAECSKATATRDLVSLLHQGCLYQLPGSGRNTRYQIQLTKV